MLACAGHECHQSKLGRYAPGRTRRVGRYHSTRRPVPAGTTLYAAAAGTYADQAPVACAAAHSVADRVADPVVGVLLRVYRRPIATCRKPGSWSASPGNAARGTPQSLSINDAPKGLGGDNSYVVRDFLNSRDALGLLLDKTDFRAEVARAGNDWFWRFPGPLTGNTDEDLYRLYQSFVKVDYDGSTGVTSLDVQAFEPEEARRLATVLIDGAEALLNRMNDRARTDAIRVAEDEVARSKQRALDQQTPKSKPVQGIYIATYCCLQRPLLAVRDFVFGHPDRVARRGHSYG